MQSAASLRNVDLWSHSQRTVELTETCFVFTINVPDFAPAGIVGVVGTYATATLLLANVTTAPPAGAGPRRVTVASDEVPPFTVAGLSVSEAITATTLRLYSIRRHRLPRVTADMIGVSLARTLSDLGGLSAGTDEQCLVIKGDAAAE